MRLKPSTIRAWILKRRIPYVKVGRLVRLKLVDLEALIEASIVPAKPPASTEQTSNDFED